MLQPDQLLKAVVEVLESGPAEVTRIVEEAAAYMVHVVKDAYLAADTEKEAVRTNYLQEALTSEPLGKTLMTVAAALNTLHGEPTASRSKALVPTSKDGMSMATAFFVYTFTCNLACVVILNLTLTLSVLLLDLASVIGIEFVSTRLAKVQALANGGLEPAAVATLLEEFDAFLVKECHAKAPGVDKKQHLVAVLKAIQTWEGVLNLASESISEGTTDGQEQCTCIDTIRKKIEAQVYQVPALVSQAWQCISPLVLNQCMSRVTKARIKGW
jgi:hypothetical protein